MRILIVITKAERGGAQAHVLDLVRGLRHRHEFMVVAGDEGWLLPEIRSLGCATAIISHLVQPIHLVRDVIALHALRGCIQSWCPDLVHAHSSKAGALARLAAASLRVPSIFTAHGWAFHPAVPARRRAIALAVERFSARAGNGIICVSRYDLDLALAAGFAHGGLRTIHNGIPDLDPEWEGGSASSDLVVMAARFSPQKDYATLVRALAMTPGVSAEFAGTGPLLPEMRELAAHLGVDSRIAFLGDRADVPEILRRAGVFVLASRFEGLPIAIIEAMRAGLPVVASDVGGVRELVEDGQTGFVVRPGDPDALAAALGRLIGNRELRRSMGAAGRSRFLANFRSDRMLALTESAWCWTLRRSAGLATGCRRQSEIALESLC